MNKNEFFKAAHSGESQPEKITVGGNAITVKVLTVREVDTLSDESKSKSYRAKLLVACCMNEDGSPLFDTSDLPELEDVPAWFVDPILVVAIRVNKLSPEDQEKLRKN